MPLDLMSSDSTSRRIRHWVTWRIVAELFRRHEPRFHLRVYELHPGGGQYDDLALYLQRNGESWPGSDLGHFTGFRRVESFHRRRGGTADTTGRRGAGTPERSHLEARGGYVWPFLCADDPKVIIDELEGLLGLPSHPGQLPVETPAVHAVWLMADVLGVACQTRESWEWRSAFLDTSDYGTGPREEFLALEHIASEVDPDSGPRGYQRYWMLVPVRTFPEISEPGVGAVVDLAGRVWTGRNLSRQTEVSELLHKQGDHPGAAAWIWSRRHRAR